jgi:hypothetical protein
VHRLIVARLIDFLDTSGQFMGLAIRTQNYLPLNFPSIGQKRVA